MSDDLTGRPPGLVRFGASCPACGVQPVDPGAVTLVLGAATETTYRFRCPHCHLDIEQQASGPCAELLQQLGVPVLAARPTTVRRPVGK